MPRRGENIYKRKDGRWEGRICGTDGRYRYVYAKTYREVKEKKNEYQKTAKKSKNQKNAAPESAARLFERWLDGDIKGQVKPSTYDSYDCCIRKYVIPFFNSVGHQYLDEASVNQIVKSIFELP